MIYLPASIFGWILLRFYLKKIMIQRLGLVRGRTLILLTTSETDNIYNTILPMLHNILTIILCLVSLYLQRHNSKSIIVVNKIIVTLSAGYFISDLYKKPDYIFVLHHMLTIFSLYSYISYDNAVYGYLLGELSNTTLYLCDIHSRLTKIYLARCEKYDPMAYPMACENVKFRICEFVVYLICRVLLPIRLYNFAGDGLANNKSLPNYIIFIYQSAGLLWCVKMINDCIEAIHISTGLL